MEELKLRVKGYQQGRAGGVGIKLTDANGTVLARSGIPLYLDEPGSTTPNGFELIAIYIGLTGLMTYRSQVAPTNNLRVTLESSSRFVIGVLTRSMSVWEETLAMWLSRISDRILSLEQMGVSLSFKQVPCDPDVLRLAMHPSYSEESYAIMPQVREE